MKTPILLAAFAVTLLAARASAIDFTPRFAETVDDGIPFRRMCFSDNGRRIFYRPHPSWVTSGDGHAATFRPKDTTQSYVRIENAPAEQALIPLEEPGLEALRKIARALVPSEATEIGESWEIVNPVVIQGWTSFEMGFDYIAAGQRCCRSVLFINLREGSQIHLIVDASPAEFGQLYKTANRTLASWWWEPETK